MIWPDRFEALERANTDPAPGPEELLDRARAERRVQELLANPGPKVQAVLGAVMERDDGQRSSIRGLSFQLGLSRYTVGKVLLQLYGEVAQDEFVGGRKVWTVEERARRWYRGLSPERKAARYLQQRARLLAKRGVPAEALEAATA